MEIEYYSNTYTKKQDRLQDRLDLHWIRHNFIEKHFTTKEVSAAALGIVEKCYTFEEILNLKMVA